VRAVSRKNSGKFSVLFNPETNTGDKGSLIERVQTSEKPGVPNFFHPETNTGKRTPELIRANDFVCTC